MHGIVSQKLLTDRIQIRTSSSAEVLSIMLCLKMYKNKEMIFA